MLLPLWLIPTSAIILAFSSPSYLYFHGFPLGFPPLHLPLLAFVFAQIAEKLTSFTSPSPFPPLFIILNISRRFLFLFCRLHCSLILRLYSYKHKIYILLCAPPMLLIMLCLICKHIASVYAFLLLHLPWHHDRQQWLFYYFNFFLSSSSASLVCFTFHVSSIHLPSYMPFFPSFSDKPTLVFFYSLFPPTLASFSYFLFFISASKWNI